PLVATEGDGFVSREHKISQSPSSVMYIYGGKLTTYRKMVEEAVDQIAEELHFRRVRRTSEIKLLAEDGQNPPAPPLRFPSFSKGGRGDFASVLSETERQRLIQRYGSGIAQIEKFIAQDVTLAEALIESLPCLKAEVHYACWGEMVIKLEDFLWRRTRIGLSKGQGIPQAPEIAKMIGQACGWNIERINTEVEQYTQRIRWLNAGI
ncbi:MAG: glycerol-3-phosphate dehydrogenase C-terminal domain-containing protein, partial [Bacteroidota bacterium]